MNSLGVICQYAGGAGAARGVDEHKTVSLMTKKRKKPAKRTTIDDGTVHTIDVVYLDTAVRYYKISRTKNSKPFDPECLNFHEDLLVLNGVSFSPEREKIIESSKPYAVNWRGNVDPIVWDAPNVWIEIDHPEEEEHNKIPIYTTEKGTFVITHHHVKRTKRTEVTSDTDSGTIAQCLIDNHPASLPTVDALEFRFTEKQMKITFENHDAKPLVCPLREFSNKTSPEPFAAYLGDGKTVLEDASWTACQQRIRKLKRENALFESEIEFWKNRAKPF